MASITIAPLAAVSTVQPRRELSHAISILGSRDGETFPIIRAPQVLRLAFDDVGYTSAFGTAANIEDISAIIAFARTWAGQGNMLVHCKAGKSRSPAAAMIALAAIDIPELEVSLSNLLSLRSYYRPNTTMLRIAERLLNRKNTLVQAARATTQVTSPQAVSAATFKFTTNPSRSSAVEIR
jgi:predicted protein tyrosine phosphatase